MMTRGPKREDLTNKKFGHLTIIKMLKTKRSKCLCECTCGHEKCPKQLIKMTQEIKKGCSACKAFNDEKRIKVITKHGDCKNYDTTYLRRAWTNIKCRCYNNNLKIYKFYGARGIKMYKPWINNYILFKNWIIKNIGEQPTSKHSIDRIDVNKGYTPGNLRWATANQQCQNTTKSTNEVIVKDIYTKYHKDKVSINKLCEVYNMPRTTVYYIAMGKTWGNITRELNKCL